MAGRGRIPRDIQPAADPAQAVAGADIICAATTALTPVFADRDLKPGVHINAIGSYTPDMQEVPAETLRRATVVVDSREACLAEAGDLIQPIRAGLFDEGHIHAELGEIVLGRKPGRRSDAEITCFKSVGLAVQDALAAHLALKNAAEMKLGQTISF
jgi:ornithine cyclodeaminase